MLYPGRELPDDVAQRLRPRRARRTYSEDRRQTATVCALLLVGYLALLTLLLIANASGVGEGVLAAVSVTALAGVGGGVGVAALGVAVLLLKWILERLHGTVTKRLLRSRLG